MLWRGPSYVLSDAMHVPEPSARFLLALYGAYLFSFIYRYYISRQTAFVQNLYWALSGWLMVVYIYGWGVWHLLLDTTLVFLTLSLMGGTLASVVITWIITMGHLVGGYFHVMYSNKIHPIAWTIPHCVLVLKMIGLAYSLYDGRQKKESLSSEDIRRNAITTPPSLLEVLGFVFFPGSVLAGPQMWFVRYREFVEGRLFDYQRTPSSSLPGIKRLLLGTALSLLYAVLNKHYPVEFLATKGFADEAFIRKLWLVFISGKVVLWRYIAVWLIAEGSCIVSGISYSGKVTEGQVEWDGLTNIKVWDYETSITLQGVVDSFNVNTNQWMAVYVYKRLKWMGSKELSMAITLVFVALWHGIWPGYYLNFSLEFLELTAERTFQRRAQKVMGRTLPETHALVRVPLSLVAYFLKNLMLMYPVALFMLLSWSQCYAFMKSVYFYGHVVPLIWIALSQFLSWLERRKRRQKVE